MKALPLAALAALLLLLTGCTLLEDNGTHLAYAMERGAKSLRASPRTETVVRYEPLEGLQGTYEITLKHSLVPVQVDFFGNINHPGGGYLVVTGTHPGGTSYHERFVFTPADLHVVKHAAPTEVVLRKNGDLIEVVELR